MASATKRYTIGAEQRHREGAVPLVARPYGGPKKSWERIGERQDLILKMAEETQILILQDRGFHSLRTPDGVGPVHDIAHWGAPKAQLYIWDNRAKFDTEEFRSRACDTPIDILAAFGCREVQEDMRKALLELIRQRARRSPLIHTLARRAREEDYLNLLGLPHDILRTRTNDKESVLGAMYHPASKGLRKEIARRFRRTLLWDGQLDCPR